MTFSCMTMKNETENWPLPLLILSGVFIAWGYAALKHGHKLKRVPQLITYTLNFELCHKSQIYLVSVIIQIPPQEKIADDNQENFSAATHITDGSKAT